MLSMQSRRGISPSTLLFNEIDLSKMRVFLSDVLFDREQDGNKNVTIPFGKQDCTVFRKVMSTEDTI